jgi:hypothetical protein
MVGKVFGEHHTHCTLETTFVDFEKEKAHCIVAIKDYTFRPSPISTLHTFPVGVKNRSHDRPLSPTFIYTF